MSLIFNLFGSMAPNKNIPLEDTFDSCGVFNEQLRMVINVIVDSINMSLDIEATCAAPSPRVDVNSIVFFGVDEKLVFVHRAFKDVGLRRT